MHYYVGVLMCRCVCVYACVCMCVCLCVCVCVAYVVFAFLRARMEVVSLTLSSVISRLCIFLSWKKFKKKSIVDFDHQIYS